MTDADRAKPLEWQGLEVRTPQGDLYTVRQLSRIVWVTSLNGTDCPGWSPTEALAKARAQAHYDNRAALAPAPQAADAEPVEPLTERQAASLAAMIRDWMSGPNPLDGDGLERIIKRRLARLTQPAAEPLSASPVPEGWVLVPANADYELIERRFDTQDWEAEDYRGAQEGYARWIAAAQEGKP